MNVPERMKRRPRDHRGYPVPWFVQWTALESDRATSEGEGRPRFPILDGAKWERAVRERRCWVCGQTLGAYKSFVIGPMCVVNLTTAEPGCHLDCAVFSAAACPFLTRPRMKRMPVPDGVMAPPGVPLDRNPGLVCVWTTRDFYILNTSQGPLIRLGEPVHDGVLWFREGRKASREEVLDGINAGLPALRDLAAADGVEAVWQLTRQIADAMHHVPRF